jgi:hypothetical protein
MIRACEQASPSRDFKIPFMRQLPGAAVKG